MSRHRGLIVLLLDAVVFATCNFLLFLPYLCSGNIKLLNLVLHMGLLSACVFVFQLLLHTYETLWRYAESREYLSLLAAALCGFAAYEVIARVSSMGTMSFVLLLGIACAWVLGMLTVRFLYRGYRTRMLRRDRSSLVPVAILGAR